MAANVTATTELADATGDGYACHLVPKSLARTETGYAIVATAVFTPVPLAADRPNDNSALLERWPSWIADHLAGGLEVRVRPALSSEGGAKAGLAVSMLEDGYEALIDSGAYATREDVLNDLRGLWKDWFSQSGSFDALRRLLAEAATARAADAFKDMIPPGGNTADGPLPDIVSVPRSDLGRKLTAARARDLLENANNALLASASTLRLDRTAWLKRLKERDFDAQPWAKPRPAGAGTADVHPFRYDETATLSKTWTDLQAELQAERYHLDGALRASMTEMRAATRRYAEARRQCSVPTDAKALYEKLTAAGAKAPACPANTPLESSVLDVPAFEAELNRDLAVHVASTLPDHGKDAPVVHDTITTRWHTLQGMHTLTRLAHTVVDIRFEIGAALLEEMAPMIPATDHAIRYLEFCVDSPIRRGPRLWTLTKLRLPDELGEAGRCWPTTVEEWATVASGLSLDRCGKVPVDTIDGVVDLEAWVDIGGTSHRRYDLLSVDMTLAAEAEVKRQRSAATGAEIASEARGVLVGGEEQETAETSTLKTAGFQIVDRWRQAAAVRQFQTSCDRIWVGEQRVDAHDLRIGHKVDVGTTIGAPVAGTSRFWTSLTDRRIEYGNSESGVDIEQLLEALVPNNGAGTSTAHRDELDGAVLGSATRLLKNADPDANSDVAKVTAFAEQVVVSWDGDPLGQRTGSFKERAGQGAIPVSQDASLPTEGQLRPLKLCFGRSYALGLRDVLAGGCTVPIDQAALAYDGGLGTGLAYPASTTEVARFLRHERINAPLVATDGELLVREHASQRGGIDGKLLVVRSEPEGLVELDEAWRFGPSETTRILFAPAVELSLAARHGVFDEAPNAAARGGLQDIDYNAEWGGFPVFDPAGPAALEAIRSSYRDDEKPKSLNDGTIVNGSAVPTGFAAVRASAGTRPRKIKYFPDPAARHLVIALRRESDPNGYLDGTAICVPLYPRAKVPTGIGTPGYPDARPVVLRVRTYDGEPDGPLSSYDQLRLRAGISSDKDWRLTRVGTGEAKEVTISLAPGEDFEIETWCIPEQAQLQAWFDLPEGVAQLRQALGSNAEACEALDTLCAEPGADLTVRRGEHTIPWQLIRDTAKALHTALQSRPLPELAAVRRLRALHATGLPATAPNFVYGNAPVRILRTSPDKLEARLGEDASAWTLDDGDDGGRELLIGGELDLDAATTEAIELQVEAAAPRGEPFDDPNRGRSFDARARGIWPRTTLDVNGKLVPVLMGRDAGADHYMRELFGFRVEPDGKVDLSPSRARLARWTVPYGQDRIELHKRTVAMVKQATNGKAAASPIEKLFPDTRARRLTLIPTATSRTARHIPERDSYPDEEQRTVDTARQILEGEAIEVVLRSTERPAALSAKSLLPAFTWYGGDVDNPNAARRTTKIRVRLKRPWWTSGEDERLGIVVWPPSILKATKSKPQPNGQPEPVSETEWTTGDLAKGIVQRFEPHTKTEIDLLDIAKKASWRQGFFTDDDLGPGGKYITRWGADPIFHSGDPLPWFIAEHHFTDVYDAPTNSFSAPVDMIATAGSDTAILWPREDRYKPRFVENVLMPVPEDDGQENDPTKPMVLGERPEFMMVSLLTYAPRFDPDFEHWYVDIELDTGYHRDPFVRLGLVRFQPHADRHLQVSAPDAKWVQIVSYDRRVNVVRETSIAPDGFTPVEFAKVVVHGGAPADAPKDRKLASDAESLPSYFRATLIECRRLALGQVSERVAYIDLPVEEAKALGIWSGEVKAEGEALTSASEMWSVPLPIPTGDADSTDVSYSVLVEEYLRAQRATYSNEPVTSPDQIKPLERWTESGPRFAVRVDVPPKKPTFQK